MEGKVQRVPAYPRPHECPSSPQQHPPPEWDLCYSRRAYTDMSSSPRVHSGQEGSLWVSYILWAWTRGGTCGRLIPEEGGWAQRVRVRPHRQEVAGIRPWSVHSTRGHRAPCRGLLWGRAPEQSELGGGGSGGGKGGGLPRGTKASLPCSHKAFVSPY